MRRLLPLLFAILALNVAAQTRPPKLEPIPEPPPPPPGRLYMQKITPPHGVSYSLGDHGGDGQWVRQDSKDAGLRVPMWVIGTF